MIDIDACLWSGEVAICPELKVTRNCQATGTGIGDWEGLGNEEWESGNGKYRVPPVPVPVQRLRHRGAWRINLEESSSQSNFPSQTQTINTKCNGKYRIVQKICTGCPKKNALLSLKAYNSGFEAAIGAIRDSSGILWL